MRRLILSRLVVGVLFGLKCFAAPTGLTALAHSFVAPPESARPWVYWTWIDGNITKEGLTEDLDAMQRVGIGGALILDVSQSMPSGPVKFFDDRWKELFKHAVDEAARLGLEININNGAGYYGSGGAWVPPDLAMQTVVQSETHLQGGSRWSGMLPRPNQNDEYRDVAVVAIVEGAKSNFKIPDFIMKSLQWKSWVAYRGTASADLDATAPAEAIVPLEHVVDLTNRMTPDGVLTWDAPPGDWTIFRFGHAWNGHVIGPSRPGDGGPETDKLSKAATDLHFNAFVKPLVSLTGPERRHTFVATHIDSWEGGGQNWTAAMREEFKKRRRYDPIVYLPVLAGRVVGDLQISERFLFDLRQTVSELMMENYSAEFQRLSHEVGLRNTFESYTTIANDLDNARFVDEPMAEFWTPNGQGADFYPTVKSMSSAAHINGQSIVGAESFTSGSREKFLWHPAMIKSIADDAFCGGINRFVFHRYAAQPFAGSVFPGMQMGPWGLHYERTNTWWEFSGPWHKYLSRCQFLLRQGTYVADVLKLESEEPLHRFQNMPLHGYSYDACGPETFLQGRVVEGRFVFPQGASYRLIVLPDAPTMTVGLLTCIRDLIQAGATVLGNPPQRTPGLTDFPKADAELKALADEIWGTDASVSSRAFGHGRVFRGISPELALASLGVSPDFSNNAGIKFIHRSVDGADVYFLSHAGGDALVANGTFRVAGKSPEFWDPQTGTITPIRSYSATTRDGTTVSIPFEPNGSAFIVFTPADAAKPSLKSILWNDILVLDRGVYFPLQPGSGPVVDLVTGDFCESGEFVLTTTDGVSRKVTVPSLPSIGVGGPWQLHFPSEAGIPGQIKMDELVSWSSLADDRVKHFSGAATYSKTLTIPPWNPSRRLYLDLGKVEVMAKVRLNGKNLGILWKPPFRIDITEAAKSGDNVLEIDVVNLWVNRLIGDEKLPEDSERNPNGTIKTWPKWLDEGKASPTGRVTFSSWRLWKKDDPLRPSGLLGPVTLHAVQRLDP